MSRVLGRLHDDEAGVAIGRVGRGTIRFAWDGDAATRFAQEQPAEPVTFALE